MIPYLFFRLILFLKNGIVTVTQWAFLKLCHYSAYNIPICYQNKYLKTLTVHGRTWDENTLTCWSMWWDLLSRVEYQPYHHTHWLQEWERIAICDYEYIHIDNVYERRTAISTCINKFNINWSLFRGFRKDNKWWMRLLGWTRCECIKIYNCIWIF